jgi:hypothetical protein
MKRKHSLLILGKKKVIVNEHILNLKQDEVKINEEVVL